RLDDVHAVDGGGHRGDLQRGRDPGARDVAEDASGLGVADFGGQVIEGVCGPGGEVAAAGGVVAHRGDHGAQLAVDRVNVAVEGGERQALLELEQRRRRAAQLGQRVPEGTELRGL